MHLIWWVARQTNKYPTLDLLDGLLLGTSATLLDAFDGATRLREIFFGEFLATDLTAFTFFAGRLPVFFAAAARARCLGELLPRRHLRR